MIHWAIVWVCSLMLPFGIIAFLIASASSISLFSGNSQFDWVGHIPGILFILGAPLLLGLYFKPSWRGFLSGCLAIVWVLALIGSYYARLIRFPDSLYPTFLILIIAGAVAILLIVSKRVKTKTDFAGLGLGLAIGYLLAFLDLYILRDRWLSQGVAVIPAIMLNAVLFPEVLSRRAGWSSVLIVVVMLVITILIAMLWP